MIDTLYPAAMTGATLVESVTVSTFPIGTRLAAHAPGYLAMILATLGDPDDAYYVLSQIEGAMGPGGVPLRLSAVRRIVKGARRELTEDAAQHQA